MINNQNLAVLSEKVAHLESAVSKSTEASGISYDNTDSGLTADDVQTAIDEVLSSVSDLVDYGNNTNGYYLKFASGALICWKSVVYTGAVNTQAGALYESSNIELGDFPVAFIEEPVVSIDVIGLGFTEGSRNASATSAGITNILRTSTIANYTANVKVLAIGKWK